MLSLTRSETTQALRRRRRRRRRRRTGSSCEKLFSLPPHYSDSMIL